jgi:hypothetical protein
VHEGKAVTKSDVETVNGVPVFGWAATSRKDGDDRCCSLSFSGNHI